MSSTQALIRAEEIVPPRPLASLAELQQVLQKLRENDAAFILTPASYITEVKPFHQISLRIVRIDPDPTKRQCYFSPKFCKQGEVALGKTAITNILGVAGASPLARRIDNRNDPHYAEFEAVCYHQDVDGVMRQYPGNKAVDLRDGSPRALQMKPDELKMARAFISENAETKAILRAIRPLFGLSQVYSATDLQRKPFVVLKLVAHWDLSDPDQKAAAIRQAEASTGRLFPSVASGPAPVEPITAPALAERTDPQPAGLLQQPATTTTTPQEPPAEATLDEDLPDFAEPSIVVCGCPCGHQLEVTPDVAELTKQATGGAIRCATCYPGRSFDYKAHAEVRDLGIPKYPGLTADRVREKWAAKEASEKKK